MGLHGLLQDSFTFALHGVAFQKTVILITTDVRNSDPHVYLSLRLTTTTTTTTTTTIAATARCK
jgi:hypothetical protein